MNRLNMWKDVKGAVRKVITITLAFKLHEKQMLIHKSKARFKVLCCGRRFGKTKYAAFAIFHELYPAGKTTRAKRVWIVAPTNPLTGEVETELIKILKPLILKHEKQKGRYWLIGGHLIELKSAESKSLKGAGLDLLVIDEAADVPDIRWEQELQPTLLDTKGKVILISTPEGRNWFWKVWQRGQDPEYPEYESWTFSSYDNPHLDPAEIDRLKRDMPELFFHQEILAEFLDDASAFFKFLDRCIVPDGDEELEFRIEYSCPKCLNKFVRALDSEVGHYRCPVCGEVIPARGVDREYYGQGVDLAQSIDFNVITTVRHDPHRAKLRVVDWVRFNSLSWREQKAIIREEVAKYGCTALVDATGGRESIVEDLQDSGIDAVPIVFTNRLKGQMLHKLAVWIQRGVLEIPESLAVLVNEMRAFQATRTEAGNWKYEAPAGQHDDCVISLALAVWGMNLPEKFYVWEDEILKLESNDKMVVRVAA